MNRLFKTYIRYSFRNFIIGSFNELAYSAAQAIVKNPGTTYNPFFVYGNTGLGKTHLIQATGTTIKINFPNKKKMAVDGAVHILMKGTTMRDTGG